MADIINFQDEVHAEVQKLLPWYVIGTLDPVDLARVDTHLASCPLCWAELESERAIVSALNGAPSNIEKGWTKLRGQIEEEPHVDRERTAGSVRQLRPGRHWPTWVIAAQTAAIVVMAVFVAMPKPERTEPYHALSSPRAGGAAAGNMIVIFQPDTTEQGLREALNAAGARVVDGPTSADAYVLAVPDARRSAALTLLRKRSTVVLAEPIERGEPQ